GLGVFVLGACFETSWKLEGAEVLNEGGSLDLGAYHMVLESVAPANGPNYDAERGTVRVTRDGAEVCVGKPERRFYPTNQQTTSEVAICTKGFSHIYMV